MTQTHEPTNSQLAERQSDCCGARVKLAFYGQPVCSNCRGEVGWNDE